MDTTIQAMEPEIPTGLEDVIRSVRNLARTTRNLGESTAKVAERELAMAIKISASLRDQMVSAEMLAAARKEELPGRLRSDAHQAVDLIADAGAVAFLVVTRFVEGFVDQRRPPITAAQPPAARH